MRFSGSLFILTLLFGFSLTSGQSVRPAGTIDMMPNINATINGAVGAKRAKILAAEKLIKSGRASTRFTTTATGINALVSTITFDPSEPQTRHEQIKYVQAQIARFDRRIRDYGLTTNDLGNALGVAAALSQSAHNDVAFSIAAVQEAAADVRKSFLQNVSVQAQTNDERFVMFGQHAIMAIQAIEAREKARTAKNHSERDQWVKKAKGYARYAYTPR